MYIKNLQLPRLYESTTGISELVASIKTAVV